MATTTLDSGAADTLGTARRRSRHPTTLDGAPAATATTYYYREAGGARGSATSAGVHPRGRRRPARGDVVTDSTPRPTHRSSAPPSTRRRATRSSTGCRSRSSCASAPRSAWASSSPRSPRDGAMTARETYARGVGSYEGQ